MSDKIEEFYRDATAFDVARVMRGETVEARFRDSENTSWYFRKLTGWSTGVFICDQDDWWQQCQVYDPPAWFLNKPDPGEGFRLLEKFPPEDLQKGDEAFDNNWNGRWGESAYAETGLGDQCESLWYRRRIETNNPTSSDSSRSRDTIPAGWRVLGKDEERLASDAYWSQGCEDWIVIGANRVKYANELDKWHAIRQVGCLDLIEGFSYILPSGKMVWVTAKGFEVV